MLLQPFVGTNTAVVVLLSAPQDIAGRITIPALICSSSVRYTGTTLRHDMAFRIASSRPKKMQKCIAAFEDGGEEDKSLPDNSPAVREAVDAQAQLWIDKGSNFAQAGDSAAALRCWDQAVLIQPDNAKVHEMRAQVLNDLDRCFEAVQAAQQAVRLRPEWPEAHITLARVQLNLGEPQLALQSYQAAAQLAPGHPDLAKELPAAQMYAKLHKQQPAGTRAHVTAPEMRPAPQNVIQGESGMGHPADAAVADAGACSSVDTGEQNSQEYHRWEGKGASTSVADQKQ